MGDVLGGLNMTIGVLAALNARTITGKGQRVDISLVDCVVASLEQAIQRYFVSGRCRAQRKQLRGNRALRLLHGKRRLSCNRLRKPETV